MKNELINLLYFLILQSYDELKSIRRSKFFHLNSHELSNRHADYLTKPDGIRQTASKFSLP